MPDRACKPPKTSRNRSPAERATRSFLALNALFFACPEPFFENQFPDLAGTGLRQRLIAEFDDARHLEFAEPLLEKLQQRFPGERRVRLAHHHGYWYLSP